MLDSFALMTKDKSKALKPKNKAVIKQTRKNEIGKILLKCTI